MTRERRIHLSHWGAFEAEVEDGVVIAVHPFRRDPDPSPVLGNIAGSLRHRARIAQPMVRAGWLDRGPGVDSRRGAEPFVPLSWATATALLARELRRVYGESGGQAVYGGSYGWASAGRFHHAQSQLHRLARRSVDGALPAPPDREQPDRAAAQPARRRRVQPVSEDPGARADPHPPR